MIGNDVVDLELARQQSDWRRKGFLDKVFSRAEQELITTSNIPDVMLWLLWSMKEAAYKAHQRRYNLPRRLNWLSHKCELYEITLKTALGTVKIEDQLYYTTSEITPDFLHTSAKLSQNSGVKNVIFEAPSSEAKKELIKKVAGHYGKGLEELELKKVTSGIPYLEIQNSCCFNHFSLSGHGRFSAYSLSLINCETPVKQS